VTGDIQTLIRDIAQNIRVTKHEMDTMGENTTHRVQLSNGDYVGVLGIWHHLHCLDHLRRMIHFEHYAATADEKEQVLYTTKHSGE
jgi:hypothetical protein